MRLQQTIIKPIVSVALCASTLLADEIIEPTGLNQIIEIIKTDERLNKKVSHESIAKAEESINAMNELIKEAIIAKGLANDDFISIADVREINHYLVENHLSEWYALRGQEAGEESSGYYLVEKKGAKTIAMNANALNLWGQIYNLGFEAYDKNRVAKFNGDKSTSFTSVGYYLGEIIKNDIANGELYNSNFKEVEGTTKTALDKIINVILTDKGLERKVSTGDLREGAKSADKMNHLIIEAIIEEGLGNDAKLTTADIRQINKYLVAKHKEEWAKLHGDDEEGLESGYHLVQNDGAYTRMFADNVINSVADGIYHLGFETSLKNRLVNEDGNANKSFEKVAWWLDTILKSELNSGKLNNPNYQEVVATTKTSLDKIVEYIYNEEGLLLKVSMDSIREGAKSANAMNELIVEAIKVTGVANDSTITSEEVGVLNEYLVTNYSNEWAQLHGDDEDGQEYGYHKIQNNGAISFTYNTNTINKLADGIYHLGFTTPYKNRLANEDGNKNVTFRNVAYWLNKSLANDYARGTFQ